ncbi:transposase [Desulfoluna butyratoxydans]|uniref:Transposase is200-like n=1 Tax=Desulfoluna butyratoxydans TaxID=231438 RepID=A0A4U8YQU7_9BACT|nr:transposase [Desulfoluna butyratoxydans]VFQ45649.1 transposase is200-like [Desulfoluna butyratoxydans]
MPRIPRMVVTDPGQKTAYHVISRTALDGLPFKQVEKDELVRIIQRYSAVYAVDVVGYAIMGSHFHLLVVVTPGEMVRRYHLLYGEGTGFPEARLSEFRDRFSSLSAYIKDIKQTFSTFYNKRKKRKGTLWGERFKSVIVQEGNALINCLAYIDLNAVRAGIVNRPEAYRWCSIGYRIQTGNREGFLSSELGTPEFGGADPATQVGSYREFLYHMGAIEKRGKANISQKILGKETSKGFKLPQAARLMYKSRYFTDSGIIGSRAFVETTYGLFKGRYQTRREKIPEAVEGIEGLFSLKRLADT